MKFLDDFDVKIKNEELLLTALTHSSYANEHNCEDYERLEYLGDAVLEVVISDYFYKNTYLREGAMTKLRANYVCEKALAQFSRDIGQYKYIRLGHGQEHNLNDTIMADVFEAVIGAIYVDQGFNVAKDYIDRIILPHIKKHESYNYDYKTKLQEVVQTDKKSLEYVVINEYGEAHNKTFEVEVKIDGKVYGKGKGKSKKAAEQMAAHDAFSKCVR